MKKYLIFILAVLLIGLIGFPAFGGIGLGVRAMGMGGAFTAVADDESAFYWNPAGITQVRFASLTFGAGVQGDDYEFISDTIDKINNTERFYLTDFENGTGYLNLGLIGGLTTRFVGVNLYSETSIGVVKETTSLTVSESSFNYGTVTVAANIGEKTSIGLNVKKVIAGVGGSVVNSSESYTEYYEGDGLGYDLGVLYRLSDQVRFGFVARNLGGKVDLEGEKDYFVGGARQDNLTKTTDLPQDYALGVSYSPFKNTLLAFDIQKCDARLGVEEQTRFRIGFEQTAAWKIFALRLGAYTDKGEPLAVTAGFGLRLIPLNIGVALVREDTADEYLVSLGLRF